MRTRTVVGTLLVFAAVGVSILGAAPTRRAVAVTFTQPTIIAGVFVNDTVVFEHDDGKMARGEPCTTVYKYDRKQKDRGDVLVAFMCIPRARPVAEKFEAIISRIDIGGTRMLVEYQFAGDNEGHGVPQYVP
jgi:hypothetical protein